jgi:TPR repeat protein
MGLGVDQNDNMAIFWYTTAAKNRCVDATISLATIYRKGIYRNGLIVYQDGNR